MSYVTFCSNLGITVTSDRTPMSVTIIIIIFRPTSTKPQAEVLKLNNVNGCNDRIPPLKGHGQALEEELCFPGVLSDNRDAPANLLRQFYGCVICHAPAVSMANGQKMWVLAKLAYLSVLFCAAL